MRSLPNLLVSLKNMRKPSTNPPNSPRANGLSCPPHPYQLFVWLALIFVQLSYLGAVAPALPETLALMVYTSNLALMIVHLSTHIWCLILNPADENVLKNWGSKTNTASFDRTQHRHVIEDQFCHICNVYVGKHTKHCSRCNKCVADFDHHCKWLNTCIGGRNYISFLLCLASAWVGCLFIALVATTAPTMYFVDRSWLRPFQSSSQDNEGSSTTAFNWDGNLTTQLAILNTTTSNELSLPTGAAPSFTFFAPVSDVTWLTVAILTAGLAAFATALLGHLLFFHIYLVCQGLSTYQLVIRQRELEANSKTTPVVPLTPPPPPPSQPLSCHSGCICPAKDKGKPPKNQVSPAMLHNTRITSAQSNHMGPTTEILNEGYSQSPTLSRTNSTHPMTNPQMLAKSVLLMERIKEGNGQAVVQNVQPITNGTATTVFSTSPQHCTNNPLASLHSQSVQHSPSLHENRRLSSLGNSKQALTEERADTSNTGYISPSFIDSPSPQRQKSDSPNLEEQNGGSLDANSRHYCWQDRDSQSLHSMETACSPKRRIISVNSSRPSLKSNDEEQGEHSNENLEDIKEEKKDKQTKWAYQSEVPRTNSVINPVWRWSMDQTHRPSCETSLPDAVITRWSFPSNQGQNPIPVQTHERWTPLLKIGPNAMASDQQLREEVLL